MDHFATDFDTDSDGVIDFEEFKALYQHLGGTIEMMAPEPEPEPERTVEDELRISMLSGHSIDRAIEAVQEGSELTVYDKTSKKKHRRFFWVRQSSGGESLELCWGKKKGATKYNTELVSEVLPGPDIKTAAELFREVRLHASCSTKRLVCALYVVVCFSLFITRVWKQCLTFLAEQTQFSILVEPCLQKLCKQSFNTYVETDALVQSRLTVSCGCYCSCGIV